MTALPDGTTQSYNGAGELTSATGPGGGVTAYGFNADGDLTSVIPPTGAAQAYGYDQADRLTSYSDASTSAVYTYDGSGSWSGQPPTPMVLTPDVLHIGSNVAKFAVRLSKAILKGGLRSKLYAYQATVIADDVSTLSDWNHILDDGQIG